MASTKETHSLQYSVFFGGEEKLISSFYNSPEVRGFPALPQKRVSLSGRLSKVDTSVH